MNSEPSIPVRDYRKAIELLEIARRREWESERLCLFSFHLQRLMALRGRGDKPLVAYAVWYEPGDYSRAAFEVLSES